MVARHSRKVRGLHAVLIPGRDGLSPRRAGYTRVSHAPVSMISSVCQRSWIFGFWPDPAKHVDGAFISVGCHGRIMIDDQRAGFFACINKGDEMCDAGNSRKVAQSAFCGVWLDGTVTILFVAVSARWCSAALATTQLGNSRSFQAQTWIVCALKDAAGTLGYRNPSDRARAPLFTPRPPDKC